MAGWIDYQGQRKNVVARRKVYRRASEGAQGRSGLKVQIAFRGRDGPMYGSDAGPFLDNSSTSALVRGRQGDSLDRLSIFFIQRFTRTVRGLQRSGLVAKRRRLPRKGPPTGVVDRAGVSREPGAPADRIFAQRGANPRGAALFE